MNTIIQVQGLQKRYGTVEALRGVDFTVERGSLFAFLGPNGAGKSTAINILCTMLSHDGGSIHIDGLERGKNDDAIRQRIGIVFQDSLLDPLLTVRENLLTRAALYPGTGKKRQLAIDTALKAVQITDLAKRRYGSLSGGQRRRADIARALVHQPSILFLDEPSTGLDPESRRSVWRTISELQRQQGMTVFLTSHYLEEAAAADYVVVIDQGKVVAQGTPHALRDQFASDSLQLKAKNPGIIRLEMERRGLAYKMQNDLVTVPLGSTLESLPLLQDLHGLYTSFQVLNGTMDDAFLAIIGKEIN